MISRQSHIRSYYGMTIIWFEHQNWPNQFPMYLFTLLSIILKFFKFLWHTVCKGIRYCVVGAQKEIVLVILRYLWQWMWKTPHKVSLFVLLLLMLYNIMFSHSTNTHELTLPILSFGVSSGCHVFYNTTMHAYVAIDVISAHVDGCHLAFESL